MAMEWYVDHSLETTHSIKCKNLGVHDVSGNTWVLGNKWFTINNDIM
jgi:hypothetical protein